MRCKNCEDNYEPTDEDRKFGFCSDSCVEEYSNPETAMLNAQARQHKIDSFNDLLDRGEVFVHINLSAYGVRVPERLKQGPQLVLKFSKRYGSKVEVLEEGVSQVLNFQGEEFPVFIEWNAIFVIRDESGKLGCAYSCSAPKELIKKADDGEPPQYLN